MYGFSPALARPCRQCRHWQSWANAARTRCTCTEAQRSVDTAVGCERWSREVGAEADDALPAEWFPTIGQGDDVVDVDPLLGISMQEWTAEGRPIYKATYVVPAPDPRLKMPMTVTGRSAHRVYLEALKRSRSGK